MKDDKCHKEFYDKNGKEITGVIMEGVRYRAISEDGGYYEGSFIDALKHVIDQWNMCDDYGNIIYTGEDLFKFINDKIKRVKNYTIPALFRNTVCSPHKYGYTTIIEFEELWPGNIKGEVKPINVEELRSKVVCLSSQMRALVKVNKNYVELLKRFILNSDEKIESVSLLQDYVSRNGYDVASAIEGLKTLSKQFC